VCGLSPRGGQCRAHVALILAFSAFSILAADKIEGMVQPVGAAVMSPWTDLALTGDCFETRAEADPIFTRGVLQAFADLYLQGQDAENPKASPLRAQLNGLPPIRIAYRSGRAWRMSSNPPSASFLRPNGP
jgi:acetyl esterase/lipase